MERLDGNFVNKETHPVKVLQFGEGNFLRAFVDYFIDIANETLGFDGSIVIVKPVSRGNLDKFIQQDCIYTVSLRGVQNGTAKIRNRIITSVKEVLDCYELYDRYMALAKEESLRFVVSNTTEAGIVFDEKDRKEERPPKTFPGKLTLFLYERYQVFQGDRSKGLVMLPVELIDDNGIQLRKCVMDYITLWNLGEDFKEWVEEACIFTSTLVDRIVTGYPKEDIAPIFEQLGYQDELLDTAEPFGLWVIESKKDISKEFPLAKAGLPVVFTDNQKPYKQRKVRILNGAHTSFVLASFLAGNDTVLESMKDPLIENFMRRTIFDEIIPTLTLPKKELDEFANSVIERFGNPYVKHMLLSISLNSISKWRARCMPSFLEYRRLMGSLPAHLTFSIAALMAFYTGEEIRGQALIGDRDGKEYEIRDNLEVLKFFQKHSNEAEREYACAVLSKESFWGVSLAEDETVQQVTEYLKKIHEVGMRDALQYYFPVTLE